jgi:hypothetical protein
MLDLARWRYDIEHHNLDTSLSDSVGDDLPAIVRALSIRKSVFRSKIVTLLSHQPCRRSLSAKSVRRLLKRAPPDPLPAG